MSKTDIKEVTPEAFLCSVGSCPSVFRTERGTFLIIGKIVDQSTKKKLPDGRIGDDELVIEVPEGLVKGI